MILLILMLTAALNAHAAPTKVGNGDDGSDLEGVKEIRSGKIFDARQAALTLLKNLNVNGVRGLGTLIPELADSKLFLADKDVNAALNEDSAKFHADYR